LPQSENAKKDAKPAAKRPSARASRVFTEEERAAMKEYARERRRRANASPEEGENDVLAKIAEMAPADRVLAERIHAIVKATAPQLVSRTWYGMPAYAKDANVVCFFQPGQKFKTRYATLGFSDKANLDDGVMWPNSYALKELTAAEEARITELVKRAVS